MFAQHLLKVFDRIGIWGIRRPSQHRSYVCKAIAEPFPRRIILQKKAAVYLSGVLGLQHQVGWWYMSK